MESLHILTRETRFALEVGGENIAQLHWPEDQTEEGRLSEYLNLG